MALTAAAGPLGELVALHDERGVLAALGGLESGRCRRGLDDRLRLRTLAALPFVGNAGLGSLAPVLLREPAVLRRRGDNDRAIATATGQVITYLLARGGRRDHQLLTVLARRVRALLGRRLAGVVADCGCISRASVAVMAATGVPCIRGFARSAPIRRRLAALSGQQRRGRRGGGTIRLGACPRDERLRLFALGARPPGDQRGPWVSVTTLRAVGPQHLAVTYRRRWRACPALVELHHGHDVDHLVSTRLHPNRVAVGFRMLARTLPSAHRSPWHRPARPPSARRAPSAPPRSRGLAPSVPSRKPSWSCRCARR